MPTKTGVCAAGIEKDKKLMDVRPHLGSLPGAGSATEAGLELAGDVEVKESSFGGAVRKSAKVTM
jgi:hypothetical protein